MPEPIIYFAGTMDAMSEQDSDVPDHTHVYHATLSSDAPVRMDNQGQPVTLVLSHKNEHVRMGRIKDGIPVLVNHDSDRVAGGTVSAALSQSGQLFVDFKLSRTELGRESATLIHDGGIRSMSVGAQIHGVPVVEESDSGTIVTVTDWEPIEASLAPIPRNHEASIMQAIGAKLNLGTHREDEEMPQTETAAHDVGQIEINQAIEAARKQEQDRIGGIMAIAKVHSCVDFAQEHVSKGTSLDAFRGMLLDRMADDPGEPSVRRIEQNSASLGMSYNEIRQYDWGRVVRALAFPGEKKHRNAAGFELECSQAAEKHMGITPKGILIPNDVLTMTGRAGTPTENAEWVATDTVGFIDNLRNNSLLMQFNPRLLTGLVGNQSIRMKTGSTTAYWTAEGGATTKSSVKSAGLPLTPHRVTAEAHYDKQLLVQTDPSVSAIYEDDMAETLALAIDKAALYGVTANEEPSGLVERGVTETQYSLGGSPDWADIVGLETTIGTANAAVQNMFYAMAAAGRGVLKTTPKETGEATYIWEPGNTVNGYPTGVSNQVDAKHYWFGNWRDLMMAMWGVLDMTADPYTRAEYNEVRLFAIQYVDSAPRHIESFALLSESPT